MLKKRVVLQSWRIAKRRKCCIRFEAPAYQVAMSVDERMNGIAGIGPRNGRRLGECSQIGGGPSE